MILKSEHPSFKTSTAFCEGYPQIMNLSVGSMSWSSSMEMLRHIWDPGPRGCVPEPKKKLPTPRVSLVSLAVSKNMFGYFVKLTMNNLQPAMSSPLAITTTSISTPSVRIPLTNSRQTLTTPLPSLTLKNGWENWNWATVWNQLLSIVSWITKSHHHHQLSLFEMTQDQSKLCQESVWSALVGSLQTAQRDYHQELI